MPEAPVPAKPVARELVYAHADYRVELMHWFCKLSLEHRTHHLHLVPFLSPLWKERLAFRDLLRTGRELALDYFALKAELARAYEFEREASTEAKSPFIGRALRTLRRTSSVIA